MQVKWRAFPSCFIMWKVLGPMKLWRCWRHSISIPVQRYLNRFSTSTQSTFTDVLKFCDGQLCFQVFPLVRCQIQSKLRKNLLFRLLSKKSRFSKKILPMKLKIRKLRITQLLLMKNLRLIHLSLKFNPKVSLNLIHTLRKNSNTFLILLTSPLTR